MTVRTNKTQLARRPGFTLVEVLTVIVIIGILASLTVGGAIAARNAVRRSIVISDMRQLESALQQYKSDHGEFPPDFANIDADSGSSPSDENIAAAQAARARVVHHLRKAFPRLVLQGTNDEERFIYFVTNFLAFLETDGDLATVNDRRAQLNPSTALAFWLGGRPGDNGRPNGFSQNPANPFQTGEPRTQPYVDFDVERLDGLQYMEPGIQNASPYVYFRAVRNNNTGDFEYGAVRTGRDGNIAFTPFCFPDPVVNATAADLCVPYMNGADWQAPETYQIIAPGLDGVFSTNTPNAEFPAVARDAATGNNFSDGDFDNLASFAEGELERDL